MNQNPQFNIERDIELSNRSGNVKIDSRLVSFLYELMRDHVSVGVIEDLISTSQESEVSYSNGWLALYAQDIANKLINESTKSS